MLHRDVGGGRIRFSGICPSFKIPISCIVDLFFSASWVVFDLTRILIAIHLLLLVVPWRHFTLI